MLTLELLSSLALDSSVVDVGLAVSFVSDPDVRTSMLSATDALTSNNSEQLGRDLVTQWKAPPSAGTPGVTHGFISYEWRGFSLSESFFTEVYIAFLINLHSNVT